MRKKTLFGEGKKLIFYSKVTAGFQKFSAKQNCYLALIN